MPASFKKLAAALARAADEKKGEQITLLHPGSKSPVADLILIVTANSRPHLQALEAGLEDAVKAFHVRPIRRAKPESDQWRVLDFGGLVVHLMTEPTRAFYSLDKLYADFPRLRWQAPARRAPAHARPH